MQTNSTGKWWTLATLLTVPALALTLAAQQTSSLLISGQQGSAKVIQVQGRNYVEVEGLAKLTNGSLSFKGNQIVLTLPGSDGTPPPPTDANAAPAPPAGFSKDFLNAGIEAMAQVREWHTALRTAIERGLPLAQDWLGAYAANARQTLRLASVAINTDSDKDAYPFLASQFNNVKNLSDKYVAMAQSMNYIAPNSLQSDPLEQKIQTCSHALSTMASSLQVVDDGSCQ
jgi:hypothetical protein